MVTAGDKSNSKIDKVKALWFHIICIILTLTFFVRTLYFYIENESTSLIEFKALGEREELDIYPSISLCPCQIAIFNENKLKEDNITEKASNYKSFLFGDQWNEKMANIDYDDYTIDLHDYLTKIVAERRGKKKETLYEWTSSNTRMDGKDIGQEKSPFFISYRSDKDKCFTLDVQQDIVERIESNTIRTVIFDFADFAIDNIGLNVFIHYPKQLFRSLPMYLIKKVEVIKPPEILVDEILINNIVVIRRRNTYREPCDEQWKSIDDNILHGIAESVGCKPRHWKLESETTNYCDSLQKMNETVIPPAYNFDSDLLDRFPPPCHQLQIVMHESRTNERNVTKWNTITTGVENNSSISNITRSMEIFFEMKYYEEVLHLQGFNFDSLLGNAGGYIGMFLGVALWQIPEIFVSCLRKMHNLCHTKVYEVKATRN